MTSPGSMSAILAVARLDLLDSASPSGRRWDQERDHLRLEFLRTQRLDRPGGIALGGGDMERGEEVLLEGRHDT